MVEFDAERFADQAQMTGVLTRHQVREAQGMTPDGSLDSLLRVLIRKGLLTGWQRDKLMKGEGTGFYYGGYKVLFHIAEGTFARVYRGVHPQHGQPVAIKVLRRRFTSDAQAVLRFNQEAESGLKLNHPNIVRIYEYGEQDKNHYMVMEFVEGSNLRDFLKIRHKMKVEEAMPVILGLARGLQYSLDNGVTHRDIKGTNILISTKGEAKLVDFGLATVGGNEDQMALAHGQTTVDYSALERTCKSPRGDYRSDIFFLGCVFYQLLTGILPLPEVEASDQLAKMLKRSFAAIKPLSETRGAPPDELCRVIEKMMKVNLDQRYDDMDDVVAALEEFQANLKTPGRPKSDAALAEFDFDNPFEVRSYAPKNLLCVEVQEQVQAVFRKTLSGMGYKVFLYRDAERAAERFRESPPDALLYDFDGLGPEALNPLLQMHERAKETGKDFATLVLLGPKQGELSAKLPTHERMVVLSKPIKMKDVQDAMSRLLPS